MGVRSRRAAAVVGGLVVLLAVVAGTMAVVMPFVSPSRQGSSQSASSPSALLSPSPQDSQSASAEPSGSSAGSAYFDDGIPRTWLGQPVLRGQAAIDAARSSTDETPFYVAFWAGIGWDRSCPQVPENEVMFDCDWLSDLGDQPGVESPVSRMLGDYLRVSVASVAPAPIIARVHTHDPACPAGAGIHCEFLMLGDVVWHGGETTAPGPITVSQAAAAFGTTTEIYPYGLNLCPVSTLPGVPMLSIWKGKPAGLPNGIVAVFPSAQSLAAAYPRVVAKGELNKAGENQDLCQGSNGMRWMARANILVGVAYDGAQDPDTDPLVLKARAALATLGN